MMKRLGAPLHYWVIALLMTSVIWVLLLPIPFENSFAIIGICMFIAMVYVFSEEEKNKIEKTRDIFQRKSIIEKTREYISNLASDLGYAKKHKTALYFGLTLLLFSSMYYLNRIHYFEYDLLYYLFIASAFTTYKLIHTIRE